MKASCTSVRQAWLLAALLCCGPVLGQDSVPAPSDPELLEFLGELGGEEALFILYTTSREAKKAAKNAATEADTGLPTEQAPTAALDWNALDAPSQGLLAAYADRWAQLQPGEQRVLADGAQHWLALDGIGRAQANERWQTWRSLTPDQRERVQDAWAKFQALTPAQQQAVRTAYLQFQELPQEERDGMLERLQGMSPEELRRKMNRRQGKSPGVEDKRPCPPC